MTTIYRSLYFAVQTLKQIRGPQCGELYIDLNCIKVRSFVLGGASTRFERVASTFGGPMSRHKDYSSISKDYPLISEVASRCLRAASPALRT
jgi:hypothetical protein